MFTVLSCRRSTISSGVARGPDDSNDSDDRRQYSGPVLFQRYTTQTRDTVESVENAASQIHPNELRDCQEEDEKDVIKASKESRRTQITCLLFSPAILLSFSTST